MTNLRHMAEPVTVKDASRILNLSRSTVTRRTLDGTIPHVAKVPGQTGAYLYDPDTLTELVTT